MKPLEPGTVVDRYVVERRIGTGGIAGVYLIRHQALGSLHALKVLQTWGGDLRQRLMEEGRAQARIQHPNVVRVTDVVDVNKMPGLVMDYVEGIDLEQLLKEERVSFAEGERIFRGILAGVAAAHASTPAVVHRDLKPANVLLFRGPKGWEPKVTDFGLAKILVDADTHAQTRTGIIFGTPSYMAPEQAWEARSADRRADLFSLGCILYELCTGARAFSGPNIYVVLENIRTGAFIPPRQRTPSIPEHLEQAIFACLQVDRDVRVQDCAALQAILDGGSWNMPEAPPPTPSEIIDPALGQAIRAHFQLDESGRAPPIGGGLTPPQGAPPAASPNRAASNEPRSSEKPTRPSAPEAEANPFRPPPRDRPQPRRVEEVPELKISVEAPRAEPPRADTPRAEPPRAAPPRAEPPRAEPPRAEPGRPQEPRRSVEPRPPEPRPAEPRPVTSLRPEPPRASDFEPPRATPRPDAKSPAARREQTENLLLGAAAVILIGGVLVAVLSFVVVTWWLDAR